MKYYGQTFDGGGSLIAGVTRYMAMLNPTLKPDFLGGTSAGSIVVGLLLSGKSWDEIDAIVNKEVNTIFAKPPWYWKMNPLKPKFQNKGLIKVLKKYMGNVKCSDFNRHFYIFVSDFGNGKPKVYDNTDDEYLWKAVLMSCSAPTYFPPVGNCADGGLWANNPAVFTIAGFKEQMEIATGNDISMDDLKLLSVGTNGDFYKKIALSENMNLVGWASRIITFSMYCTESSGHFVASRLLDKANYRRIEPKLAKGYDLATLGDDMIKYRRIWEDYFYDNMEDMKYW